MEEKTIEGDFDLATGVWHPEYEYSSDQASKDIFTYGPIDVVKTMLLKLDPKSFTNTCGTNTRVRKICRDNHFQQAYVDRWSMRINAMLFVISEKSKNTTRDLEFYKIWSAISGYKWDGTIIQVARKGNVDMIKLALEDPKISIKNLNSGMTNASIYGHASVVKLLLQDGRADPAIQNNISIRRAAEQGHKEVVRLLLQDPRVDPTANRNGALRNAVVEGHTEVVKLLLEDGRTNPGADNDEAIIQAAEGGYLEIVELLLDSGRVDPTAQDYEAIKIAKRNEHREVAELLEKHYRKYRKITKKTTERMLRKHKTSKK
jgi:hypothetical protein